MILLLSVPLCFLLLNPCPSVLLCLKVFAACANYSALKYFNSEFVMILSRYDSVYLPTASSKAFVSIRVYQCLSVVNLLLGCGSAAPVLLCIIVFSSFANS